MLLRFAVFGDVHGRVPLMLLLSRAWQQAHDLPLDGILQVGDMGAFPDHTRLDKATARYAKDDPDELDFREFITVTSLAEALLADEDTPPVAFCRGNHEDLDYLGRYRVPTALDPYNKLWFVPDGQVMHWRTPSGSLTVGAFGGAPPTRAPEGRGTHPRRRREPTRRWALEPRFAEDAAGRAFAAGERVDVLLTHGGPEHDAFPHGCGLLAGLAERVKPRAHLFGHHHEVVGPARSPDGLLVGLEHLQFRTDQSLRAGAWGVLEIDEAHVDFQFMDQADHAWLAPFRRRSWRWLLPQM